VPPTALGTHAWTVRTGGRLTRSERRALLVPLARAHAGNLVGRTAMLLRVNAGRRVTLDVTALAPPTSPLAAAAEERAKQLLPPVLLQHCYRTYAFGAALGQLEGLDVDAELLFAAAMLHDVGLCGPRRDVDFTLAGARAARDVAEEVGLSSAATDVVRDAITLHHTPGVTRAHGPVAYLLSAGAGADVAGLRTWQLPASLLGQIVTNHPRCGFKRDFGALWRAEAAALPAGRARLLQRYGALGLAIALAPFPE
jgi:hypothetical protein